MLLVADIDGRYPLQYLIVDAAYMREAEAKQAEAEA